MLTCCQHHHLQHLMCNGKVASSTADARKLTQVASENTQVGRLATAVFQAVMQQELFTQTSAQHAVMAAAVMQSCSQQHLDLVAQHAVAAQP